MKIQGPDGSNIAYPAPGVPSGAEAERLLLLLVEDEVLIGLLLREVLEEAGFEVLVARDGSTAISELEAGAERLRGVITDIRLASGPSGWEIARRARELSPGLPVVYVSGDSAHEWTAQGVPGSVMVGKPFLPAQVLTAVTSLLNGMPPS